MQRKVMISCAVTGSADTPGKNPAVPVTPAQIAASAIDAAKAGAAIVHIHVRDPKTTLPSMVGNTLEASYLSTTAPYYVNNGKIVTSQVGTPIEITVYKAGGKYLAARSNEFGYANYEIIPAVAALNPLGPIGASPRK